MAKLEQNHRSFGSFSSKLSFTFQFRILQNSLLSTCHHYFLGVHISGGSLCFINKKTFPLVFVSIITPSLKTYMFPISISLPKKKKKVKCLRALWQKAPIFCNLFFLERSYQELDPIPALCSAKPHLSKASLILLQLHWEEKLATLLLPPSLCTGEVRFGL